MRTVFTNAELPHRWAYARQAHGRNGTQSLYFNGDTIYSYGEHFPIARRLRHDLFAVTTASYSITTTGHKRHVQAAIPSWARVLRVDNPNMSADVADRQRVEAAIQRQLDRSTSKRIKPATRESCLAAAISMADNFNAYAEAVGSDQRVTMMSDGVMSMSVEQLRHYAIELNLQREAEEKKREAETAVRLAEQIERWKRGDMAVSSHDIRNAPVCLRLSRTAMAIETSRGAAVPVGESRRLWTLIQRAIRGQRAYEPGASIGGYTLVKIRRDGSIVIGCHDIAYAEIERIAALLGLTATEEAPAHG